MLFTHEIVTKLKILLDLHTALHICHLLFVDDCFMTTPHECLDDTIHNPNKWAASMKYEFSKCMPHHAVYQMLSIYSRRILQQYIQRLDWLL